MGIYISKATTATKVMNATLVIAPTQDSSLATNAKTRLMLTLERQEATGDHDTLRQTLRGLLREVAAEPSYSTEAREELHQRFDVLRLVRRLDQLLHGS